MESASTQRRVTFVEVVVVATMLAILAAFAVPRLPASRIESRSVAAATLADRIRTSVAMAHARWLTQGRPPSIDIDGLKIAMTFGYPDTGSIDRIVRDLDGFVYDDADGIFAGTVDGRTPIAGCAVVYAAPETPGAAPGIKLETSGC